MWPKERRDLCQLPGAGSARSVSGAGEGTVRLVYITLGADGLLLIDGDGCRHIPGIRVPDPVDTVGAGRQRHGRDPGIA